MTDRHKRKPVQFRPPESDERWLTEHARRTGRPKGAILRDALAAYRASHDDTPREISR